MPKYSDVLSDLTRMYWPATLSSFSSGMRGAPRTIVARILNSKFITKYTNKTSINEEILESCRKQNADPPIRDVLAFHVNVTLTICLSECDDRSLDLDVPQSACAYLPDSQYFALPMAWTSKFQKQIWVISIFVLIVGVTHRNQSGIPF